MANLLHAVPAPLQTPFYWAIRAVLGAVGSGDLAANLRMARSAGRLVANAKFNRKRLKKAMTHLAVAYPDWPEQKRREHAVLSYEHLFALGIEVISSQRLITEDNWANHVRVDGLDRPLRIMLGERPCVLTTGHCGNWELLGLTLSLLGFPVHALYRPLDLKPLDEWLRRSRQARGLMLVDKFGAGKDLPEIFEAGGTPGIVGDQNAGDRGLFVPFFGRLASTYKTIGLLAMAYRAPVIVGAARRVVEPGASGDRAALSYLVTTGDVIMPEEWEAQPDPLFYITARYRRGMETLVRAAPEQNLWMHRYWKSRPRHEKLGREFPGALREKLRALPWMTEEEMGRIEEHSRRDTATIAAGGVPC